MAPQLIAFLVGVGMIVIGFLAGGGGVFTMIRKLGTPVPVSDTDDQARSGCLAGGLGALVAIALVNLGGLVVLGALIWAAISFFTSR